MIRYGFEREKQAEVVLKLEDALEAVGTTVDLTPSMPTWSCPQLRKVWAPEAIRDRAPHRQISPPGSLGLACADRS